MNPVELTRVGMPLSEFIRQHEAEPFELINGEKWLKMTTVAGHNFLMNLLYRLLLAYFTPQNPGEVFMEATYILPDTYDSDWVNGSRTPDLLVYTGSRFADYQQAHTDWRSKPYMLVPDVVIEIISPNDGFSKLDEKVDAYLADGVRLVWLLDPQRRKAIVYTPDAEQPHYLLRDARLDGDDILPGFSVALTQLFEG
jgi:Uma2 family endonuclease